MKTFRKSITLLLSVALLLSLPGVSTSVFAKVTEDDKASVEEQIKNNDRELDRIEETLEQLRKDSAEAIALKKQLDAQAQKLQDNIDLTEELIQAYEESIQKAIEDIGKKQREVDARYEQVKESLRQSYENSTMGYLEIIFSSTSFIELLTRAERLVSLVSYREKQMEELRKERELLEVLKKGYENDLARTQQLRADLEEDKIALNANIAEAVKIIEGLEDKTDAAQSQKDKYEQAEKDLEDELQDIIDELERQAAAGLAQGDWMWPVPENHRYISSYFGWRSDPFTGESAYHNGMDIPADTGDPIYASNNGTVVKASYNESYGYYVMLSHGDGITTLYAHNSKLLVSVGEVVEKGTVIAKAGSSGRSTGPHCHFEMRIDDKRVDPMDKSNRGGAYVVRPD